MEKGEFVKDRKRVKGEFDAARQLKAVESPYPSSLTFSSIGIQCSGVRDRDFWRTCVDWK